MDTISLYLSFATGIGSVIAVLFIMHLTGHVENRVQFALAAGFILAVGVFLARVEIAADNNAKMTLQTLFGLPGNAEVLVFNRHASKGTRTQRIEAIYKLGVETFETSMEPPPKPFHGVSFNYRISDGLTGLNYRRIEAFAVAEDALEWHALPRAGEGYYPRRGHYSLQRTAEKDMTGAYLCAFIPVERQKPFQNMYDVIPCHSVENASPDGITVLGYLNAQDNSLHVLVE
ncbi:MAG: hypothetical protein HKN27_16045 [Silicimonas sp.]|nr:hypothetical protein [Silicimonas sp.]